MVDFYIMMIDAGETTLEKVNPKWRDAVAAKLAERAAKTAKN